VNDPNRWHTSDRSDDDAIFAEIVAHINDDVADPRQTAQQPGAEDATGDDGASAEPSANAAAEPSANAAAEPAADAADSAGEVELRPDLRPELPSRPDDPQVLPSPQVWRAPEVDAEDEHFEPPQVTPLPAGDLQFWGILAGMGGGPLLLVYLVFFNRDASSYWMLTALAMSVGGFALLVSRLPGQHEDDDDGARL
jgi:hypothetical protein